MRSLLMSVESLCIVWKKFVHFFNNCRSCNFPKVSHKLFRLAICLRPVGVIRWCLKPMSVVNALNWWLLKGAPLSVVRTFRMPFIDNTLSNTGMPVLALVEFRLLDIASISRSLPKCIFRTGTVRRNQRWPILPCMFGRVWHLQRWRVRLAWDAFFDPFCHHLVNFWKPCLCSK